MVHFVQLEAYRDDLATYVDSFWHKVIPEGLSPASFPDFSKEADLRKARKWLKDQGYSEIKTTRLTIGGDL